MTISNNAQLKRSGCRNPISFHHQAHRRRIGRSKNHSGERKRIGKSGSGAPSGEPPAGEHDAAEEEKPERSEKIGSRISFKYRHFRVGAACLRGCVAKIGFAGIGKMNRSLQKTFFALSDFEKTSFARSQERSRTGGSFGCELVACTVAKIDRKRSAERIGCDRKNLTGLQVFAREKFFFRANFFQKTVEQNHKCGQTACV